MDSFPITPLEQQLKNLEQQINEGHEMQSLQTHSGWIRLRKIIDGMLEAYKNDLVSDKYINDHNGYLAIVGAHNALQSIINKVDRIAANGAKAVTEKKQIETDSAEELQRIRQERAQTQQL